MGSCKADPQVDRHSCGALFCLDDLPNLAVNFWDNQELASSLQKCLDLRTSRLENAA